MKPTTGFIVRILAKEESNLEFLGTGILVAPGYVLTAAHTILGIDPESFTGWANVYQKQLPFTLIVSFGTQPGATQRKGAVVATAAPDLALIRLDWPVDKIEPARFAVNLHSHGELAISQLRGLVFGYSSDKHDELLECPFAPQNSPIRNSRTRELRTLQVAGGLPLGMSGSPLVIKAADKWICLGMVYLGRLGSPVSQLILSDLLVRFLVQHKVPCLAPVAAAKHVPNTLGVLLQRQRAIRGMTQRQLATDIGVSENTLRDWETDVHIPAALYRERLFSQLFQGEPRAAEEWSKLVTSLDVQGKSDDVVARLRLRAKLGGLIVEPAENYRTIGRPAKPKCPRFEIGSRVKIVVTLPWSANVTFLNIEGIESVSRSYYCLDPLLGLAQPLPAGKTILPAGRPFLPVGDPPSTNCLVMLALRRRFVHWSKAGTTAPDRISESEILQKLSTLAKLKDDELFVAICEYEVLSAYRNR